MDEPIPSSKTPTRRGFRPNRWRRSRAGFSSWTLPRCARSSCAVARGLGSVTRPLAPHKAERVAMEEVKRGLVYYDMPTAKPAPGEAEA